MNGFLYDPSAIALWLYMARGNLVGLHNDLLAY